MRFVLITLIFILGLSACATPSQVMVRKDGATVRCGATGIGIIGVPAALIANSTCISDYKDLGYIPIEEYKDNKGNNKQALTSISKLESEMPSQTISISDDNCGYALTLSSDWSKRSLPENIKNVPCSVQMINIKKDIAFILATENSEDIADLNAYGEERKRKLLNALSSGQATENQKILLNGVDSVRFEASGITTDGIKVHYLMTMIRSDKKLIKLNAWTSESKFASARDEIEQLSRQVKF